MWVIVCKLFLVVCLIFSVCCIAGLYRVFVKLPEGADKNEVAMGVIAEVIIFAYCIIKLITT